MDGIRGDSNELHLTNSSDVLTKLEGLVRITPPNPTIGDIDDTDQDDEGVAAYIPGIINPGKMTFVVKYVPGSETDLLLREHRDSRSIRAFKIVKKNVTPNREETGSLYINSYTPDELAPGDTVATATVTAQVRALTSEADKP